MYFVYFRNKPNSFLLLNHVKSRFLRKLFICKFCGTRTVRKCWSLMAEVWTHYPSTAHRRDRHRKLFPSIIKWLRHYITTCRSAFKFWSIPMRKIQNLPGVTPPEGFSNLGSLWSRGWVYSKASQTWEIFRGKY
jgi:hypothetical protein